MGHIVSAKAYANDEVALIAWSLAGPIPNCLGFEIMRIYPDTGEERVLPAWVPFKGQTNKGWEPQTTSVWPVQKLFWRDLTVRKRRDRAELRPVDVKIKYRIRPLVTPQPGLQPVTNIPPKTYEGDPVPLAYADDGIETNEVLVTGKYGDIHAAFTNGILAAQWLRCALESLGQALTPDVVRQHISTEGDQIRQYLTGDVLGTLRELLERAGQEPGAEVRLALYELSDRELKDLIVAHKDQVHLILSNTSKDSQTGKWDATNSAFRAELHQALGSKIVDRMFNNEHIGHNKFAVYVGADGTPQAVMTGSTNWTPTGLCGQSNNAMIIESPDLAKQYDGYWSRLLTDTELFKKPQPLTASTSNCQGSALRTTNAKPPVEITLPDGTSLSLWCAPNTKTTTKGTACPPDLTDVFSLMRKAHDVILFAAFLPSRSGKTSIIEEAITLGQKDPSLIVHGSVSDPTAMPNYVPPAKNTGGKGDGQSSKKAQPAVYDKGNVHVVRAAALTQDDLVGQFESELLKVGNAIIHDKIVVVDPLSDEGFVAMGSHNLGYKASYMNDENLLILRHNRALVQAYAVHVLDVYEHYRYRALELDLHNQGKKMWDGFISRDAKWLDAWLNSDKGSLARYLGR